MAERKPVRRRSMGGAIALLILGLVVAAPILFQSNLGSTTPSQTAQPMELRGHWIGMGLAPAQSVTAQQLGVPAGVSGVVVAELPGPGVGRAAAAGLQVGDVIVRVDGSAVADLAALYTLTTRLDVGRPLGLEIIRGGQPMTVSVPAPPGAPMGGAGAMPPAGVVGPTLQQPGVAQAAVPGAAVPGAAAPQSSPTPVSPIAGAAQAAESWGGVPVQPNPVMAPGW